MLATFERRVMETFLGLVPDNVGNADEMTALWRLPEQVLPIILSFGDATRRISPLGDSPCARPLTVLARHAGRKISEIDYTEGFFYREVLTHLRVVQSHRRLSKIEEKRLKDMEQIVHAWNTVLRTARRLLRVHVWHDPLSPRLQVLPGGQT